MSDGFVYFFTGMMIGLILGVFVMAVAMAAGKKREETDNREQNLLYNKDVIFLRNNEEIVKMEDGRYLVRTRK